MDKLSLTKSPSHQFSTDEIIELETLYLEMGEKSLHQNFCQELAINFRSTSNCASKTSLSWQQVQHWFQNKQKESQANVTPSPNELKLVVDHSDASNRLKNSPSPKGKQVTDLSGLTYEARSSKDLGWHDVALFLNYRVMNTSEVEARVRYAGYGKEYDEWVNVKEGVRERSTPLVPSECHKVKDGDLVLCFKGSDISDLYYDARVVKIQRKEHGEEECKCIFNVQFIHDNSKEVISWDRLCRRPTQEEPMASIFSSNPIESLRE